MNRGFLIVAALYSGSDDECNRFWERERERGLKGERKSSLGHDEDDYVLKVHPTIERDN